MLAAFSPGLSIQPQHVHSLARLGVRAGFVAVCIAAHIQEGHDTLTITQLAKELRTGWNQVKRAIRTLTDAGMLQAETAPGRQDGFRFRLLLDADPPSELPGPSFGAEDAPVGDRSPEAPVFAFGDCTPDCLNVRHALQLIGIPLGLAESILSDKPADLVARAARRTLDYQDYLVRNGKPGLSSPAGFFGRLLSSQDIRTPDGSPQ